MAQKPQKITLEQVAEKCKDLPFDKRLTIKVARFSISNSKAQGQFGAEMATMLTNALQKTSCFRVLEMNRNAMDGSDEGGDGTEAQLTVTGEVTEFSEKKLKVLGVERNTVSVGFILKVLNPQTNDILFSESVNGEGSSSGLSSTWVTSTNLTGAVANASEQAIIRAVEVLADKKDKIEAPVLVPVKKFNAANCAVLRNGRGPKVMILIPEAQTLGGPVTNQQYERQLTAAELERQERKEVRETLVSIFGRNKQNNAAQTQPQQQSVNANAVRKDVVIEQATAENEIIKRFIEAGFRVIDPKVYDRMRKESDNIGDDAAKMAALGLKLGANIIITGFAVSERVSNKEGNFSFRGRLELRALTTDDATILVSHTTQAGGVDPAESIASQKSLRNASTKMANYMLEQLCARNLDFADSGTGKPGATTVRPTQPGASANATEIAVSNVNYAKLQTLATALLKNTKVKGVKKNLKTGSTEGTLQIEHTGSTDELIDALGKNPALKFEVTGVEEGKASLAMN